MLETLVEIDFSDNMPRRLKFTHRWGVRIRYQIDFGSENLFVRTPLVRGYRHGKQFEFALPCGDQISAACEPSLAITIRVNDDVVATFAPSLCLDDAETEGREKQNQIATVWLGKQPLPLICSVCCNYFPYNYRILSAAGSRMCYWRKSAGWGAENAILMISRRVEQSFIPVAISATLISLLLDGIGD